MTKLSHSAHPDVRKLSVLAYELNSLALAAAAEAATLARGNWSDGDDGHGDDDGLLAAEMHDLIQRLQVGTRAMRVARRRGGVPRG